MIRVLQIVSSMDRGGLEAFIMNVYRNIDRDLLQFDFLLHTDKECAYNEEIRSLGGRIYSVPARNKGVLENKRALRKFFKAHPGYRIVHQHVSSLSYVEPLKAAKRHGVPVRIVHIHNTREGGNKLHKYIHFYNRLFLESFATDYFACSDLAAKWLLGEKQFKEGKYKIINNGIETEKFVFNPEVRKKMRQELGIGEKIVLGHVGRMTYAKNHEFLIDIFKAVHEKRPDSVLLLVGDGELRAQIEQKVRDYGLEGSVIMTGVRSDVAALLQAMDAFVMPSRFEGLPVALVEAQAAGLLCVVSDNITKQVKITDLIHYVELAKTASEWCDEILKLLPAHARRDTVREIIAAGFDIGQIARDLQDGYLKMSERQTGNNYDKH